MTVVVGDLQSIARRFQRAHPEGGEPTQAVSLDRITLELTAPEWVSLLDQWRVRNTDSAKLVITVDGSEVGTFMLSAIDDRTG
ncbi:hypothetical protein [Streptomyces sp. Inha503]|uniref:hypothetical protein n=1 Tax=Streptomyces sp. Inha503 TaxID=3383314 RepID=UPI0039A20C4F